MISYKSLFHQSSPKLIILIIIFIFSFTVLYKFLTNIFPRVDEPILTGLIDMILESQGF